MQYASRRAIKEFYGFSSGKFLLFIEWLWGGEGTTYCAKVAAEKDCWIFAISSCARAIRLMARMRWSCHLFGKSVISLLCQVLNSRNITKRSWAIGCSTERIECWNLLICSNVDLMCFVSKSDTLKRFSLLDTAFAMDTFQLMVVLCDGIDTCKYPHTLLFTGARISSTHVNTTDTSTHQHSPFRRSGLWCVDVILSVMLNVPCWYTVFI